MTKKSFYQRHHGKIVVGTVTAAGIAVGFLGGLEFVGIDGLDQIIEKVEQIQDTAKEVVSKGIGESIYEKSPKTIDYLIGEGVEHLIYWAALASISTVCYKLYDLYRKNIKPHKRRS